VKFRWKVTLCTVCLMSVLFGIGSSMLLSHSFSNALERERAAAQDSYRSLLETLQLAEEMGALRNNRQLSDLLTQLTPQEAAAWSALELLSGETVILRTGDAVGSLVHSASADREDQNTVAYFSDPRDRQYLQLSGRFSVDDQPYVLTIAYDISSIYEARTSQLRAYWFIFLGMLCLGAGLSYLVSMGLTRPLTRLSTATRAISDGDLSTRVNLQTGDEIGAVGADFDTMAKKMEETVSQLRQSMERQERFIGSFTHELKTPMTAMIGYADLLRQQTLTPEEQQDAANYIFSEARRLERLSIKLLEIQVREHTQPELAAASPAALLRDLAEHLGPGLAADGIVLSTDCDEGLCLLEVDLVRSLLINLMDNAHKAMPHGGKMHLQGQLTEQGCILTVEDTGCGIPPEALAHLTEAFYRVDKARSRAQGGAGLGLTLCARIAELHNGALHFESTPGQGTRVSAELKGGRVS
jgi:signal transduction histidine kinase